ncbi:motility associated factor glycosyltransferase family protein [Paenibacillus humicola]|uniref:motility associated factor glycosyltransferase family protein n=1 Tax=Paenibacillus humicola TaxID=3110540 RepID=UPI00237A4759|nr:6-hydroxymethylpterin diphosphokinase MptE-like protein [Paenibacillus humicola]
MRKLRFIQPKSEIRWPGPAVDLDRAANGTWTASISAGEGRPVYLHSRYDPEAEAERFAAAQLRNIGGDEPEWFLIYGLGCGHHIRAVLKQTAAGRADVEVWETNVAAFYRMDEQGVLNDLMDDQRFRCIVSDDMNLFSARLKEREGSRLHLIVHEPSLKAVPEGLRALKQLLQEYQMKQNSALLHLQLLRENFNRNMRQKRPSLSAFRGLPSAPVILISAGPSLTHSLPGLADAAKHCLLGSVGTAAPVLRRCGIQPDFVVMTDPQPKMLEQLEGWDTKNIPLFFLSTLFAGVVERYPGPSFILFQEDFDGSEQAAALREEPLVPTGGSVSTTMFSLARLLGLGPICLVGQDLAYTDNRTHAEGAHLYREWGHAAAGERVRSVDGSGTVATSRNFLLYKKWFEAQVRDVPETCYNATGSGADIEGFEHLTLARFLAKVSGHDAAAARTQFQRAVRTASGMDLE